MQWPPPGSMKNGICHYALLSGRKFLLTVRWGCFIFGTVDNFDFHSEDKTFLNRNCIRHRNVRQKTSGTSLAQEPRLPRTVSPPRHHARGTVCPPPSELPPVLLHFESSLRPISTASVPSDWIYIRASAPFGIQARYKY